MIAALARFTQPGERIYLKRLAAPVGLDHGPADALRPMKKRRGALLDDTLDMGRLSRVHAATREREWHPGRSAARVIDRFRGRDEAGYLRAASGGV